jgi:hypothetical protein
MVSLEEVVEDAVEDAAQKKHKAARTSLIASRIRWEDIGGMRGRVGKPLI